MGRKKKRSPEFWIGRFAVEIAVAMTAIERRDSDMAYEGLKECLDNYLNSNPDPELVEYLNEMKRDEQALTPVDIPYRGGGKLTGEEISRMM